MGLISSIAEKAIVGTVTTAFPPFGWLLSSLGGIENGLLWWFGNLNRSLGTALALVSLLAWHFDSLAVKNADLAAKNALALKVQANSYIAAQAQAKQIAQQKLDHQNAVSAANAQRIQNGYQKQLTDARSAMDDYRSKHSLSALGLLYRTKAATSGGTGQPSASTPDNGSGVPQEMPADSVVVSAHDLQQCTDSVTYAIKSHQWSETINDVN